MTYAVIFDFDTSELMTHYGNTSINNAWCDIKKFLTQNGFNRVQGNVYFGDDTITPVKCVVVIQKLAKAFPWFSLCVKDVRMLKIEENNDLMPAIE
jgi:virulence-associated protein VapD